MLHKIVTASLVLVGLVLAGLSVASGTLWRPSDTAVMTTGAQSGSTLLTTAPGVLGLVDDSVTITATSSPEATVVLAVGREVDVTGWIGEDPSLLVTGASDWETLAVTARTGAATEPATPDPAAPTDDAATDPAAPTDEAAPTDDAATDAAPADDAATDAAPAEGETAPTDAVPEIGPDPSGSDMWLTSSSGTGSASLTWDASSSDEVLLVAAVGENATTPVLTLSWPREVTTPWMLPGIVLGGLLVVAGCVYGFLFLRTRDKVATAPTNSRLSSTVRPTTSTTSTTSSDATTTGATTTDAATTVTGAPTWRTGPGTTADADKFSAAGASSTPTTVESGDSATGSQPTVSTDTASLAIGLTRRELREQAAREEAARLEEVNAAARRSKRAWPWTGAIPAVKKAEPAPPAAPPAVDPARPVWLPEGTASTSGSSWRAAWGVRPETGPPADSTTPQNNTTTTAANDTTTDDTTTNDTTTNDTTTEGR